MVSVIIIMFNLTSKCSSLKLHLNISIILNIYDYVRARAPPQKTCNLDHLEHLDQATRARARPQNMQSRSSRTSWTFGPNLNISNMSNIRKFQVHQTATRTSRTSWRCSRCSRFHVSWGARAPAGPYSFRYTDTRARPPKTWNLEHLEHLEHFRDAKNEYLKALNPTLGLG